MKDFFSDYSEYETGCISAYLRHSDAYFVFQEKYQKKIDTLMRDFIKSPDLLSNEQKMTARTYLREYFVSNAENMLRHQVLLAKLLKLGYLITEIKSSYKDVFDVECSECSLFVVDGLGIGRGLKQDLKILGAEFEQDFVSYALPSKEYQIIPTHPYKKEKILHVNTDKLKALKDEEFFSKIKTKQHHITDTKIPYQISGIASGYRKSNFIKTNITKDLKEFRNESKKLAESGDVYKFFG